MFREPKAMREIHKIQEEIYREEKGLTSGQRLRRVKEAARKLLAEYGNQSKAHGINGAHSGK